MCSFLMTVLVLPKADPASLSDLNKWHVDNLLTHIAALSLFIDDWRTDSYDLREDLRLDSKQ